MFSSCVSLYDREMDVNEREQDQILGKITTEFNSFQVFHIQNKKSIKQKAYQELLKAARREYQGNIEIKNIEITGSWSFMQLLNILGYGVGITGIPIMFSEASYFDSIDYQKPLLNLLAGVAMPIVIGFSGNTQKITATGDVVLTSGGIRGQVSLMETVIESASETLIENIRPNSTIAILSVYSHDRETSEYIIDELEYKLVASQKFWIVDRRRLEQIRREQNFQLSGEVDDNSAISIGNLLGASIVITGDISGSGISRRLVLKALDVKTAQIVTMARERF